jgi:hypothetical protein
MISLLYPLIVTEPDSIGITVYSIIAIFLLFSVNLINPMKLSYKAYMLLKKQSRKEGE